MKHTQTIALSNILPNPYRDFDIYPIDAETVTMLAKSYDPADGNRDFGSIAVRPVGGGMFEQVFGHHRVEAMRSLGLTEGRFLVESIDDDRMVKEMTAENASQRGQLFAAQVDSVAAIMRRLAYWLLISETSEQFDALLDKDDSGAPEPSSTDKRDLFHFSKAALLRGKGLGSNVIRSYAPTMTKSAIEGAIGYLKDSGLVTGLIDKVKAKVDAEVKAEEAAQKERVAKAEAARKKAQEEERKAIEAAKVAAEAAAKASAAKKKQAEADAKVAADRSAKLAALREAELKKEAARRKEEAERLAKQRLVAEQAETARREFAEQTKGIDPALLTELRGERHLREFRPKAIAFPGVFPIERQVEMVREMYETMDAVRGKHGATSAEDVVSWCNEQIAKFDKVARDRLAKIQKQREAQSKSIKAAALLDEVRASMNRFTDAMGAVIRACDADAELNAIVMGDLEFKVGGAVDAMETAVTIFRKRYGIKTQSSSKRHEKAIAEYHDAA